MTSTSAESYSYTDIDGHKPSYTVIYLHRHMTSYTFGEKCIPVYTRYIILKKVYTLILVYQVYDPIWQGMGYGVIYRVYDSIWQYMSGCQDSRCILVVHIISNIMMVMNHRYLMNHDIIDLDYDISIPIIGNIICDIIDMISTMISQFNLWYHSWNHIYHDDIIVHNCPMISKFGQLEWYHSQSHTVIA